MERGEVTWAGLFFDRVGWAPTPFFVLALILGVMAYGIYDPNRAVQLERQGVDTSGRVTYLGISNPGNPLSRSYSVSYTFQPAEGPEIQGWFQISRRLHEGLREGDSVPVRYLPQAPRFNAVEPSRFLNGLRIVVWVLVALGAVAAIWAQRQISRLLRLVCQGELRAAEVTGHTRGRLARARHSKLRTPHFHIAWRDSTGAEGETSVAVPQADLPVVGATIRLYVDPATGRAYSDWEIR